MTVESGHQQSPPPADRVPVLIMGMGIDLYGKEKRMIRMVSGMHHCDPVFMISSWDRGDVTRELTARGLKWRKATFGYLGLVHWNWMLKNFLLMPTLFYRLRQARKMHRTRVLLFAEPQSFLNAFPVFACWKVLRRMRIAFYLGDIGGRTRMQRWMLRLADRFADVFVVNSRAVRDGIQQAGVIQTAIHVVYNGVDLEQFRDGAPIQHPGLQHWPAQVVVFGYVGQITPNKGVADFLDAARLVQLRNPAARFLVVGQCPGQSDYLSTLKREFSDLGEAVCFTGLVQDIGSAYARMDVVVVPSRHPDPAPNVNLEAMACGKPVIATNTGGSPELIQDGVTGLLCAPAAPGQLADCMTRLGDDSELRQQMGSQGRLRCEQLFDIGKNAAVVESLVLNRYAAQATMDSAGSARHSAKAVEVCD